MVEKVFQLTKFSKEPPCLLPSIMLFLWHFVKSISKVSFFTNLLPAGIYIAKEAGLVCPPLSLF